MLHLRENITDLCACKPDNMPKGLLVSDCTR